MAISPELIELLAKAETAYEATTPEQKEEMRRKQRESYVRAEMQWAKDFREGKCKYD